MTKAQTLLPLIAVSAALAVVSAHADEPAIPASHWQSSASLGLTLTRGNSDTLLAALGASTSKKWQDNELTLGADATYGKSKVNGQSSTTADSVHGFAQYNRLFNQRLYGYFKLDGLHDEVADVKYRVTLAPGLGYYFIKEKTTEFSVEAGPGYVIEKLGNNRDSYATLRLGEKFKHELSEHSRIWQSAEILPQVDDFNNYIINAEIGIEADLTKDKRMTLRAYLQDTYNNVPAPGREKNDAKLVAAIGYKF